MIQPLFISEDLLKEYSPLSGTLDFDYLKSHIVTAQDYHIQPTLGGALFARLSTAIYNDTLTDNEAILVEDYIAKTLVHYSLYDAISFLVVKLENSSIVTKSINDSSAITFEDAKLLEAKTIAKAEFYKQRLIDYLNANSALYPEYTADSLLKKSDANYDFGFNFEDDNSTTNYQTVPPAPLFSGVHNDTTQRDDLDAHPIESITALSEVLQSLADSISAIVSGHAIKDSTTTFAQKENLKFTGDVTITNGLTDTEVVIAPNSLKKTGDTLETTTLPAKYKHLVQLENGNITLVDGEQGNNTTTVENVTVYNPSLAYTAGNTFVSYSNPLNPDPNYTTPNIWRCKLDALAGQSPETNPELWEFNGTEIQVVNDNTSKLYISNIQSPLSEVKQITGYKNGDNIIIPEYNIYLTFDSLAVFGEVYNPELHTYPGITKPNDWTEVTGGWVEGGTMTKHRNFFEDAPQLREWARNYSEKDTAVDLSTGNILQLRRGTYVDNGTTIIVPNYKLSEIPCAFVKIGSLGGDTSNLVPYSGATQNVDLGNFKVLAKGITLPNSPITTPTAGDLYYDPIELSLTFVGYDGTTLQIGQEQYVLVVNKTGSQFSDGWAGYINSAQGNRPTVARADSSNLNASAVIGVATQNIANNVEGKLTTFGIVHGYNTSSFTDGASLWLNGNTISTTKPTTGYIVHIGYALNSTTNGSIFVNPSRPLALDLKSQSTEIAPTVSAITSYLRDEAEVGGVYWYQGAGVALGGFSIAITDFFETHINLLDSVGTGGLFTFGTSGASIIIDSTDSKFTQTAKWRGLGYVVSTNTLNFYSDGLLTGTSTPARTLSSFTNVVNGYSNGGVRKAYAWLSNLTDTQRSNIMLNGFADAPLFSVTDKMRLRLEPSSVAYDGTISRWNDTSGFNNHATILGLMVNPKPWATLDLARQLSVDTERKGLLNDNQITVSFNDTTQTLTVTPVSGTWSYYYLGIKVSGIGTKTKQITSPVNGTKYWFYIADNSGNINYTTVFDISLIVVASVIYNSTLTPKYVLAKEYHTALIDNRVNTILHKTQGAKASLLPNISGYTVNGTTDLNKKISITASEIVDQDLIHVIASLTAGNATALDYFIWYRTNANTWVWALSNMPFAYNIGNTSNSIMYDVNGVLTNGVSGRWYNSYLLITNIDGVARYSFVAGRGSFTSLANAQAENVSGFDWSGFDISESVIAYRLTFAHTGIVGKGGCVLASAPQLVNITPSFAIASVTTSLLTSQIIATATTNYPQTDQEAKNTAYETALTNLDTNCILFETIYDNGYVSRPYDFKVTAKNDVGGVSTIKTSSDVAYTLGETVTAGDYLKVYGNTANMRAFLTVLKV